jgi:hypothetical protein
VLNLMPAPADVYPTAAGGAHPCANFDLYDAAAWKLDLPPPEHEALQSALDDTAAPHRDLHHWHADLDPDLRERMAIIARRTAVRPCSTWATVPASAPGGATWTA